MQKHPDFDFETERLAYTKEYMEYLLEESLHAVKTSQENIRHSLADLDALDSSLSYSNVLTNARFFEMARTQKEGLEAIRKKPYFGRIHFQKDGEPAEFLYIGKTSLFHRETQEPIIVDWRSPIANVYYDGRLGDLTYQVRNEEFSGHLLSKRQYKIEEGTLLDIRDIDLTTNDELLQEALAGKADVRLTEIVSTIQAEQNAIIRAHLKQPIIVQGAAGSGKTTIALHRISYFLYTMGEHFPAEKLMILAPNKLFIDYIGDVLPELGVGRICQTTFVDYIQNALNLTLSLSNPTEKLEAIIEEKCSDKISIKISQMKGSLRYKEIMDLYLAKIEFEIAELFEDVFIEQYRILKGSSLQKIFLEDFSYLPFEKRLERIKGIIQSDVRRKRKEIYSHLKKNYEQALDKALYGIRDDEKRKDALTKLLAERDRRLPAVEKEGKTVVSAYMKRFKKIDCKKRYREWLTSSVLQEELAPEWGNAFQKSFYSHHMKERWEFEDLAALYYIHAKCKGIDDRWKMRVVFIDEVQDYSEFQLAALQAGLETDMFTMVGDLAQGIHSYRSITSWEPVKNLFPRATFTTLQKSYRTTIEIMNRANQILATMDEELPQVEPVVRHGKEPEYIQMDTFDPFTIWKAYEDIRSRGHRSIALICKTGMEASNISKLLSSRGMAVQLLDEKSDVDQNCLLLVPSYLSKGLEFDAVLIAAFDHPFTNHPIDRKLLYVAMTRAMHELLFIGPTEEMFR